MNRVQEVISRYQDCEKFWTTYACKNKICDKKWNYGNRILLKKKWEELAELSHQELSDEEHKKLQRLLFIEALYNMPSAKFFEMFPQMIDNQ